eukprot:37118-Eustigmatos_ZCMA.PRE.1
MGPTTVAPGHGWHRLMLMRSLLVVTVTAGFPSSRDIRSSRHTVHPDGVPLKQYSDEWLYDKQWHDHGQQWVCRVRTHSKSTIYHVFGDTVIACHRQFDLLWVDYDHQPHKQYHYL